MTASIPKRIQRKRTKGYKMPAGVIYAGRPGILGNPFKTAEEFRRWLNGATGTGGGGLRRLAILKRIPELRGKDLACWCRLCEHHKDGRPWNEPCVDCVPCHVDVLLEAANGGER